jgi:hypothetical protein
MKITRLSDVLVQEPVIQIKGGWVYFTQCPNPDYCYWADGIKTPGRLLGLIQHLSAKNWCTTRTIKELIAHFGAEHVDHNFGGPT